VKEKLKAYKNIDLYSNIRMTSVVIVEKAGTLKNLKWKSFNAEDIYKKAGFKSDKGFAEQTQWNIELKDGSKYFIKLFAKAEGRANQENKYDMPPPVDKVLYFGSCVLINYKDEDGEEVSNLTTSEWGKCYEHLFGGFESLGSDEDEEDEEDEYDDLEKTAQGYAKDDFIVDDDEEIVYETKRKKKLNKSNRSHISSSSDEEFEYSSELEEEEYI
tara:strand:- start:193 stop:837 length:645 start_codon:yes stop_codon:yes gene_type:complete